MYRLLQSYLCVFVFLLGATVHAQTLGSTESGEPPQYFIGDTGVSRIPLKQLAGVVPPPPAQLAVLAKVRAQVAVATEQELARGGQATAISRPFGDVRDQCSPTAKAFDYRNVGVILNVRDQKTCGSCAIFAAVAAFEASWTILNNNQKLDVSEQQILDCVQDLACTGGWHGKVFDYLKSPGGTSEDNRQYENQKFGSCRPSRLPTYTSVNWSYVNPDASTPSTAIMKQALCDRGPIVVAMLATTKFQQYTEGLFNEGAEGIGIADVNHDVLIVGWDDNKGGWLIKNSWNEAWGEKGFGWVKYRTNNIGYGAAWVQAFKQPSVTSTVSLESELRRAEEAKKRGQQQTLRELGASKAGSIDKAIQQLLPYLKKLN